ncbi:hypothetical protein [Psychromicrobium sp. YIM B11713]|uniref:hypothetical protein n=1 Tax=Psychromicrobium sp. YIM B11713 TaxID=3145233 RepID=UPI00374F6855
MQSGKVIAKTTQAKTKGELRARAKREANEIMTGPGNTIWSGTSLVLDYLENVTLPALESERLAEATRRRYALAYRLLRGECRVAHKHAHSLAGLSLRDAMRPRNLKLCLEEIAELHGAVNMKHAKIVAKRYLAEPLRVDEIIEHNPLTDLALDATKAKKPDYRRGGRSLTLTEYQDVIEYLLAADPEDVLDPKRGRWTRQDRIVERAGVIDIVLAQASTGMRISELCLRPVEDCVMDESGVFIFFLDPSATKNRRGRSVAVTDPRVSERMERRKNSGSPWMFPMPTDSSGLWHPRNRDRKLAKLYNELAENLKIDMLENERGHSWRTTWNTLLYDALPESVRIYHLGHTKDVNRLYYTGAMDSRILVEAAGILRRNPK